jgi:RNA polymerase sigma factor (sigma-70 family)
MTKPKSTVQEDQVRKNRSERFQKLLNGIITQDNREMGEVYESCYQDLRLFSYSILRDWDEAHEAAAHCMEKMLANAASIDEPVKWAVVVVGNYCKTFLSREARRRDIRDNNYAYLQNDREEASILGEIFGEELQQCIEENLSGLDADMIGLFAMGYSAKEIAEQLNMTSKTVSNRLCLAKKALKEKLRP